MRAMTKEEKRKYREIVSQAKQLYFDPAVLFAGGTVHEQPLYVCMGKNKQYYFSRYPSESEEEGM